MLNTMQILKWTHIYTINHKAILIVQKSLLYHCHSDENSVGEGGHSYNKD